MRIVADARHLDHGRGVGRAAARLLRSLREGFPEDDWIAHAPRGSAVRRASFAAAAAAGRPRLDRLAGGADVVWLPAPRPVAVSPGVPYVLTVHDLSWLERPQDFTAYERLWHRLGRFERLARGAAAVIAVSAATRDALRRAWGLEAEVVRWGPGTIEAPSGTAPSLARAPYLLAVGALEPRKAPEVLAAGFARAREQGLRAELLVAGEGRLAGLLDGEGVRRLGAVGDRELAPLYAGALAVVHPAWLEGFGLPAVEAAALGTPSVVADLPVHRETVGDGALRFPPGDTEALAAALLRLERDAGLRARLAAAGAAAVARLSWERAARETHAVLTRAASR